MKDLAHGFAVEYTLCHTGSCMEFTSSAQSRIHSSNMMLAAASILFKKLGWQWNLKAVVLQIGSGPYNVDKSFFPTVEDRTVHGVPPPEHGIAFMGSDNPDHWMLAVYCQGQFYVLLDGLDVKRDALAEKAMDAFTKFGFKRCEAKKVQFWNQSDDWG